MLDKTERIEKVLPNLIKFFNLTEMESRVARRAAHLCKADLMTHMVIEMTSLQGVMGRYYALKSGESEDVAKAIYEHYLPRFTGDQMPGTRPGLALSLADRLDTLAGLFAAGLAPSGTKDPFAQRRAALGLVQMLIAWDLDFDLREGIQLAASVLPMEMKPEDMKACLEFINGRLQSNLLEQGYRYDVVAAVLAAQGHNPAAAVRAIQTLMDWIKRSDWEKILPTYSRCVRITRDLKTVYQVSPTLLKEDSERELFAGLVSVSNFERRPGSMADFFHIFMPLMPVINQFFDEVLVMAEDQAVRENRLGMLQGIALLAQGVADFSLLEGF
jgi:glycyl-tRNA synthetase